MVIVYEMIAVPGLFPVTIPVVAPTVATNELLLVHPPPAESSVNKNGTPTQPLSGPTITSTKGSGFIVMIIWVVSIE